jgi:hypothetical protein
VAETKSKMTFDEAMGEISLIARDGEGADKFRALKMVMSQEAGSAAIPDPLNDAEIIERLSRLIRAVGPTAAMLAYRKAFPKSKRPINHVSPKLLETDVPPVDITKLPRNLRELYRMFPEIKKPGIPVGFPRGSGIAVQKEWCQKAARRMLLDREQKKLDIISFEAAPPDQVSEDE